MPYGEAREATCSSTPEARYPAGNEFRPNRRLSSFMSFSRFGRASRVLIGQRGVHHLLGLGKDGLQVSLVLEALGIDLVDGLGSRRARCEPAVARHDLQTLDRG